jgi:hypothetical protein
MSTAPSLHAIAKALGGEVSGRSVLAPGPGHSATDRSLSITLSTTARDGFVVHSFAGDDDMDCRDYVCDRSGLKRRGRETEVAQDNYLRLLRSSKRRVPLPQDPARICQWD